MAHVNSFYGYYWFYGYFTQRKELTLAWSSNGKPG